MRPIILAFLALLLTGSPEPAPAPTKSSPESVVSLMHQAAALRKSGDYAAAAETYRRVLKRAPSLYEAHLFLGDTLRRRHLNAEAEAEFLVARRLRPAEPLPYLSLADLQREAFQFSQAQATLEDALRAVPAAKREPILISRGIILRQSGEPAAAVAVLGEAAKSYPESAKVQKALAQSLMDLGRIEEAVQAFSAALSHSPGSASMEEELQSARELLESLQKAEAVAKAPGADFAAWESLARLRYQARAYSLAATAASEALKRSKGKSSLLLLRAIALERSGNPAEAGPELKKIPREAPEHLLSLYHRAYLARLQGQSAAEEKIWAEATQWHREDSTSRLMRVLSWKRSGDLTQRLDALQKKNAAGKGGESDLLLEALALDELGKSGEAAKLYAKIFLSNPGDPESSARLSGVMARSPDLLRAWLQDEVPVTQAGGQSDAAGQALLKARLLEAAGRRDAALETLRGAAKKYPEQGEIALALAVLLGDRAADEKEASDWLAKALLLEPDSPWPILQGGLVRLRANDATGALAEAQRAIALAPGRVEAWQLAGSSRRLAGEYTGAIQYLSRSLLMDPADSLGVARFQLALSQAAAGNTFAARQALEGDLPPFPELIYRLAWSFAERNFLDQSFRGQDWLAQRDGFTDASAAPAQAYAAVAEMLATLGDPYTRLRGTEETESLYLRRRSDSLDTDRSGAPTSSSSTFITRDLGGDIGYLRLTSFSDPSSREAIRKALERMAEDQGLVLDLRGNAGGLASEADAIAGMLMETGETLGIQRSAAGDAIQKVPQTRPVFSRKPMVILTDRRTGSAAEKLAAGLQGSGRATVLGEGTFGKGAAQMSRLLPGGPMVLVTAVESLSPSGAAIQGRGVIPDVSAEEDESLEKAKEILKQPTP
ncbi:MAG: S41 family peptidase [Acidobacteria bacterium]|nr:S41 family peptidase [Acidobacteriota bacterium]